MEGFYMESLFQVVICLAKDWGLHYHERRGKHILRGNLHPLHLAEDFIYALEHLFLFLITAQKKEFSWVFIHNSLSCNTFAIIQLSQLSVNCSPRKYLLKCFIQAIEQDEGDCKTALSVSPEWLPLLGWCRSSEVSPPQLWAHAPGESQKRPVFSPFCRPQHYG